MPAVFKPYARIEDLIEHVKAHVTLWYHAPMDHAPAIVRVRRFMIDNDNWDKSTATLWTAANGRFTVNLAEHLDRFRTRELTEPCPDLAQPAAEAREAQL